MKNITTYIIAFTLLLISSAFAETYEVQMLNKLEKDRNVFNPSIIYINSGDTVKWISVDKGHNIAFTKKGVPDGVDLFKSKINTDLKNAQKILDEDGYPDDKNKPKADLNTERSNWASYPIIFGEKK